jgi:hypothetical protein
MVEPADAAPTPPGDESVPDAIATLVRARAGATPPGRAFLVVVDGPAGSGKTTLAALLAPRLAVAVPVVHLDDLYEGWEAGPDGGAARLASWVLGPLGEGRPGRYRRYDWVADRYAEQHDVPLAPYVVIEGCGAGGRAVDAHPRLLVWVEAEEGERLRRGLARDGEGERAHWLAWMADEAAHYERERTRERADVVLDGFGRVVGWPAQ